MADSTISALPLAGPLTGAEVVVIVQGGVTAQVTLAAIKAFVTASTGGTLDFSDPGNSGLLPTL